MGIVVNPSKAFKLCEGFKIGENELLLKSEGVKGWLSDEQEKKCKVIILHNAVGKKIFNSYEEALKAEVAYIPNNIKHMAAMSLCGVG